MITETKRSYQRSKKRNDKLGGVFKKCQHARREWDLCPCPWRYAVTCKGTETLPWANGKSRHTGKIPKVTSEQDARMAYKLIVARVQNGQTPLELEQVATSAIGLSVEQVGIEWLAHKRNRKASTIESYRDHLRAHIHPVIGTRPIEAVTTSECEQLILGLTRKRGTAPLAIETKQRVAITVQALFSFAVDRKMRLDNPAARLPGIVEDPDASPDEEVIDPADHSRYFPADEAATLLRTAETQFPAWYLFVRIAIECGLRMGELVALRYSHISWSGQHLKIKAAFVKGLPTSPKNGSARTVSISRDLRARLRLRWREHRDYERLIFSSQAGTPVDAGNFRMRTWTDLLEAAKLDYRPPHAMRHSHTSLLLQQGVPPSKVAAEAGRSVQETMKTYAHFMPGGNRDDADRLAASLGYGGRKDPRIFSAGSIGRQRPSTAANEQRLRQVS